MRIRIGLSAFLLCLSIALCGQTPWETVSREEFISVLKQVNTSMSLCKTLEVKLEHRITDLHDNKVVAESHGFFKRKDSTLLRSLVFGVETIQNREYKVVVDTQERSVIVAKPAPMTPYGDLTTMERSFKQYPIHKITKGRDEEGRLTYKIDFSDEDFQMSAMSISLTDDMLIAEYSVDLNQSSNENYPQAKTRSLITFSNYLVNRSIPEKEFSTDDIIKARDNRLSVTGKYINYELINTYR